MLQTARNVGTRTGCTADGPLSHPRIGQGSLLSAGLQLFIVRNGPPDCCGYESVHALRVVGDPWDEATVTWNTRPNVRSDSVTRFFETGRPISLGNGRPLVFSVLDEVNRWYLGVTSAGGWNNYGWRLDRGDANVPDDNGSDNGFWWGARESSDIRHWPKLTVTWE